MVAETPEAAASAAEDAEAEAIGVSARDVYKSGARAANAAFEEAEEGEEVKVFDGLTIIKEAGELKDKGNDCVKRKEHNEAVKLYTKGLQVLERCFGYPMLLEENEQVIALKATLHSNTAQCMLSLELYRRAIESATACIKFDAKNVKAYYRRSQAHEKLNELQEALRDLLLVKKSGGGGLNEKALSDKCEELYERQIAENKQVNEVGKANEDLFKMKENFEEVMEKYDLGDGVAAPLVARWIVEDDNLSKTVDKVAKKWEMSKKEAEHFCKWLKKGIEMKVIPVPKPEQKADPPTAAA